MALCLNTIPLFLSLSLSLLIHLFSPYLRNKSTIYLNLLYFLMLYFDFQLPTIIKLTQKFVAYLFASVINPLIQIAQSGQVAIRLYLANWLSQQLNGLTTYYQYQALGSRAGEQRERKEIDMKKKKKSLILYDSYESLNFLAATCLWFQLKWFIM